MPNGYTQIHATVTPDVPNGPNVGIHVVGTQPYVQSNGNINLAAGQSYEITFTLAGANGVNSWDQGAPFGNQADGTCPGPGQGACPPFSLQPGGNATSMKVLVGGQASGAQTQYRLNYNDGLSTDPIIVVN